MAVVVMVGAAAGIGAIGLGVTDVSTMVAASVLVLGAWVLWATVIVTLGTRALSQPETKSDVPELLRVLGYAAAPGVFFVLVAMRSTAPLVLIIVSMWMIAAAVVGVRQALDYERMSRSIAVCAIAFVIAAGAMIAVSLALSTTVG